MKGAFVDPITKLSAKELDDRKHVASVSMRRTADLAIGMGKQVLEAAYSEAHLAILRAVTEDEVDKIERDHNSAVLKLKGVFDAFDEA